MKLVLIKGKHSDLGTPGRVHIPARDGGHLIVKPHRQTQDTAQLPFNEAQELPLMERLGKLILERAFGPHFFNTQENGNWSAKKPIEKQHAIRHIYGRCEDAVTQPFGEALRFPHSDDLQGFGYEYSTKEIAALKWATSMVLNESWVPEEYKQMNKPTAPHRRQPPAP